MAKLLSLVGLAISLLPFATSNPIPQATATTALPVGTSHANLNLLAKRERKLYFGTATDNPELTDKPYVKILDDSAMFGQLTPANAMKWVWSSYIYIVAVTVLTTFLGKL